MRATWQKGILLDESVYMVCGHQSVHMLYLRTPPNNGTRPGIMNKKLEDVNVHARVVPADCRRRRRRVLCTDLRIP
jgi:hypothetical protein